jgi:hypothetical protein
MSEINWGWGTPVPDPVPVPEPPLAPEPAPVKPLDPEALLEPPPTVAEIVERLVAKRSSGQDIDLNDLQYLQRLVKAG